MTLYKDDEIKRLDEARNAIPKTASQHLPGNLGQAAQKELENVFGGMQEVLKGVIDTFVEATNIDLRGDAGACVVIPGVDDFREKFGIISPPIDLPDDADSPIQQNLNDGAVFIRCYECNVIGVLEGEAADKFRNDFRCAPQGTIVVIVTEGCPNCRKEKSKISIPVVIEMKIRSVGFDPSEFFDKPEM